MDLVPDGTSPQRIGGESSAPSHVYSEGIDPPSSNAGEDKSNVAISERSGSNCFSASSPFEHEMETAVTANRSSIGGKSDIRILVIFNLRCGMKKPPKFGSRASNLDGANGQD